MPGLGLRLIFAAFCSALIGWNREREDMPAWLRTHMLVSVGAASFTIFMLEMIHHYPERLPPRAIRRVCMEGIAAGIGFLGAGSIRGSGSAVEGVTTAAGTWVVGAVGITYASGVYPSPSSRCC